MACQQRDGAPFVSRVSLATAMDGAPVPCQANGMGHAGSVPVDSHWAHCSPSSKRARCS